MLSKVSQWKNIDLVSLFLWLFFVFIDDNSDAAAVFAAPDDAVNGDTGASKKFQLNMAFYH